MRAERVNIVTADLKLKFRADNIRVCEKFLNNVNYMNKPILIRVDYG